MRNMRIRILSFLLGLSCIAATPALANWQYDGVYVGDGWYTDDGSRFVMSVRGGASFGTASIKNKIGSLSAYYYEIDGEIQPSAACGDSCSSYPFAGMADLAQLPATNNFETFAFVAGGSMGFTIPHRPQWRVELGWDHISESEYNSSPLFSGDLTLTSGYTLNIPSGSVQSKVTTDIISAMIFYDFFDGYYKPLQMAIPYIGFGAGYADTKTVMNMSDLYGDMSSSIDLQNFGTPDEWGVLQFYRSTTNTSNVSFLVAGGVSYGINETTFVDFGMRIAYIPKIKWALTNADNTRQRDWFSGENLIYTNVMLGLRFEF